MRMLTTLTWRAGDAEYVSPHDLLSDRRRGSRMLEGIGRAWHGRRPRIAGVGLLGVLCSLALAGMDCPVAFADSNAGQVRPIGGTPERSDPGPELMGLRTSHSRTYVGPNGRGRLAQVFAEPIHYRSGGRWRVIDNALRPSANGLGFVNGRNSFDLELPRRLSDGTPTVSAGSHSVGLGLSGAEDVVADVTGAVATYRDVDTSVGLTYQAMASGVKETIVLADAKAPSPDRA